PDLRAGLLQYRFVRGVLPLHKVLDYSEEPLALSPLSLLCGKEVQLRRRVVHHLREDHCPCRRERPPRPPQVERAGVAVADRLLPRCGLVYRFQWKSHFDQFLPTDRHVWRIAFDTE